jgi:hypothetical protein
MARQSRILIGISAAAIAVCSLATGPVAAQAPKAATKAYVQPKTPDGQPDISGFWTNATYVPLERPKGVTKEFYTPEEMAKIERDAAVREAELAEPGTQRDVHYSNAQFGLQFSQGTFASNLRTGLIVDPPDGRIPPQIPEAVQRNAAIAAARKARADLGVSHLDLPLAARCLTTTADGPPHIGNNDLSNYQFIQSPGYVTILVERGRTARIIPLDGRPFPSSKLRNWFGSSRGHWEGNTLVVETRNSNGRVQASSQLQIKGGSEDIRVIERFTRVSADRIDYRFTVDDPKTWARSFSAEGPFERLEPQGPIFEYACHEGNLGMMGILSGARADEKAAEEARKKRSN